MHYFKTISEFKLELQSGNPQFGSKSTIFLSCVTLKFDRWSWKRIGHLFRATWSFVHHLKAISDFQLELQSRNAQFGWTLAILCPAWPWNLRDDLEKKIGHLFYAASSFVHHFIAICELKLELQSRNAKFGSKLILLKLDSNHQLFSPCDLEIWWMTRKNSRAPILCYFKLFASFLSHWCVQTGLTVRKRLIWVKIPVNMPLQDPYRI